ncbi:unnamed protein product [Rotaria sp. Silwood2]|nr:unnamed protein product [Rotaria sp. Silwood2]
MVDEVTKKTLSNIPLLKTKASPRDGEQWRQRLKEELQALIQVNLLRESIQISKFESSLNRTVRSVPLVIYPDSSSLFKPKVKMKAGV